MWRPRPRKTRSSQINLVYRDQFPNLKGSENSEGDIFVQVGAAEGADRDLSLVENNQVTCILASHWLGGTGGAGDQDMTSGPGLGSHAGQVAHWSRVRIRQTKKIPSPGAPIILRSGGVCHNPGASYSSYGLSLTYQNTETMVPLMRLFVLLD